MEVTVNQALQKGIEAHKVGKVQEADRYYTAILKINPNHPDANHNMGVLAVGIGKVNEALLFFKTAIKVKPSNAQFWLSYIDALIKLDRISDATAVLNQAKSYGAKGASLDQIEIRLASLTPKNSNTQEPSQEQLKSLIRMYTNCQYQQAVNKGSQLLKQFPNSINIFNIIGAANHGLGKLEKAVGSYRKALTIKPDYADAYYNMGNALKDQRKLKEAVEAYSKALIIKPDYAEAYNNMGTAIEECGKPEDAIEAYTKAITIKPEYVEAYYNIGIALQKQGKPEDAIKAYNKALSIKPDYAEAFNNMGNALKEQGKIDKAITAYNKALSIKADYADAHRNLSSIKQYTENDKQFLQLQKLYKQDGLSEYGRCNLSFALSKMYDDIGDLNQAFSHLTKANALRKKLLNYSINQDIKLFNNLKKAQPKLLESSLDIDKGDSEFSPVFIVGMPRSGTTLVEQIISSHSAVNGAGELNYVAQYGGNLAINSISKNTLHVSDFRYRYLTELSKLSNGESIVTDKMPQNFRFIALICAAFPEAKIIHVQRNAAATCWSNYKSYFASESIGYCYELDDIITYFGLYKDLMEFWQSVYSSKIYKLNYEDLTIDLEKQARELIKYLNLNWEDSCLSPQKNERSVRTASQQQVRQKVYKGSSEAWRKYESYLNGAFDNLQSL